MSHRHPLLLLQLRRLGVAPEVETPSAAQWLGLLERVSRTYTQSDDNRHLLERAQRISSQELHELYGRIEEAQRIAGLGNWTWDRLPHQRRWSQESSRRFGFDPNDPAPRYLALLHRIDARQRRGMHAALRGALRDAHPFEIELRLRLPDNETRWVRVFGNPIRDTDGSVARIHGAIVDITRGKLAELRQSMAHSVTRLLAAPGAPEDIMPQILRTVCETIGWTCGAFWAPEKPPRTAFRRTSAWSVPGSPAERFYRTCDGRIDTDHGSGPVARIVQCEAPVWVADIGPAAREAGLRAAFGFPVRHENGNVAGVLEFFTGDAEETDEALLHTAQSLGRQIAQFLQHKQAETALRESEADLRVLIQQTEHALREAEQANTAKSKFLAAASHDLRQPLQSLMLLASVLSHTAGDADSRRIAGDIGKCIDSLNSLCSSLLDISRLDAGVVHPQITNVSLSDLFERLHCEFEPEASRKNLKLHSPTVPFMVRSDPHLLERILRNYLSNAIRYTDTGEITLRAVPVDGAAGAASTVRIEVADTGRGIPLEQHQEIYREFWQLDNPERDSAKGLGLGLSIVDRLARLLQHPIGVDSAPGRGSVFSITVPAGTAVATPSPAVGDCAPAEFNGLSVLVIDDERSVRDALGALLTQWGCECLLADSEAQALERLAAAGRAPDAIIADYRLRENRTGTQAIRRVQQQYGVTIPAIVVTGDTAPDRLREAVASGCRLLHKPARPDMLRDFLRQTRVKRGADRDINPIRVVPGRR